METLKNMTLKNIAAACGGTYYGPKELEQIEITGVEKDSRLIEEGYLYLPFVGNVVDGHEFISQVFEKGALCTLSEKELDIKDKPYILVDSVGVALKQIAAFYREQINTKIIGITGSVGKTSTKEMIAAVLSQKFCVHKTAGNYNNEIGMPLTILQIRERHEVAVVEMGISDFNEMHRLSQVAKPDICVITNIGDCHLENLKDRDGVLKAKSEIFDFAKDDALVVLNGDDEKLATIKPTANRKIVFYGQNSNRSINATNVKSNGILGTTLTINYNGESFDTRIPVAGKHMVNHSLAATCIAKSLGMTNEEIDKGIQSLETIDGRNKIIKNNKYTIIDSCYNANPMSMISSLDVLDETIGRKVAIIGDMFELGDNEEQLHSSVGEYASTKNIDVIICVGRLSKFIYDSIKKTKKENLYYFNDKQELIDNLFNLLKKDDIVLVKASNGMKFKEIVKILSEA
ncbi:MAG: UDP-N-acetylmuramoyl-tripeptide--D-alanyl-D-alanine ligase [Lachnospiraceae bacterium]|nr:UDP-N-acetylmuramoyl-tripeptide--D-alanyl-D-alanine ligase [Lachnospiraceae bacterium]